MTSSSRKVQCKVAFLYLNMNIIRVNRLEMKSQKEKKKNEDPLLVNRVIPLPELYCVVQVSFKSFLEKIKMISVSL